MLAARTPASATLHLAAAVITGTVLAVDGTGANRTVSLRPSNDNDAVIHVLIDRINAVVVHDVRRLSAPTCPREALSR